MKREERKGLSEKKPHELMSEIRYNFNDVAKVVHQIFDEYIEWNKWQQSLSCLVFQ